MIGDGRFRFQICLLTFFALFIVASPSTAAFKYLREGMTAPAVNGIDIVSDKPIHYEEWLGDNVVVVIFWASWSTRSLDQLVDMAALVNEHTDLSFQVVAVNVDRVSLTSLEMDRIEAIIDDFALPYPVVLDEGLDLFYQYGVIAVPSTAIVDTEGVLRYGPAGYSLSIRDRIEDSIKVLLGLMPPTDSGLADIVYQPTKKAGRYYNMAVNQKGREQYQRALANLGLAELADPQFAQPHILRGDIYLALDSVTLAGKSFARAVELDSASVVAWAGLGASHVRNREFDSAWRELTTARQLDDTYTPAMFSLGLCLAERGDLTAAIDSLTWARDLNERDPLTYYYLGKVHRQAGNTAEAVSAYRSALDLLFPGP